MALKLPRRFPPLTPCIAALVLSNRWEGAPSYSEIYDHIEENQLWSVEWIAELRQINERPEGFFPHHYTAAEELLFSSKLITLQKFNIINFYEACKAEKYTYFFKYLLRMYAVNYIEGGVLRYIIGEYKLLSHIPFIERKSQIQTLQKLAKHIGDRKSLQELSRAQWREKIYRNVRNG